MKRVEIFLLLSLTAFFYSCNQEYPLISHDSYFCNELYSRNIAFDECLEEGSVALFNAEGGLQIDNQLFTLVKGKWVSEELFSWKEVERETYITALYPVYEGNAYTAETLYSVDGLNDILVAKDTLSGKQEVELQFSHLFSKFTLRIKAALHDNLKELCLTTPLKVCSLSVTGGTLTLSDEGHTTIRTRNDSGEYSFMIPPGESCSLSLLLVMNDGKEYAFVLDPHNFKGGYSYECDVVDTKPGIRTVEDLKAFSLLINGNTYTGEKSLSDFGSMEKGVMVYRLLSDLVLTAEDCEELLPIGYKNGMPFASTFDGRNHTISNLVIQTKESVAGLFGRVDENGTVKDLHLDGCAASADVVSATVGTGFLVGLCSGVVDGCSVSNATLAVNENIPTGGLVGTLRTGRIVNSFTYRNSLSSKGNLGGIAGVSNGGIIVNSFSASNKLYRKYTLCGGIVGSSSNGTLENCYLFDLDLVVTSKCGLLIGYSRSSTVKNVFYDTSFNLISDSAGDVLVENVPYYRDRFTTVDGKEPIYELLQEWVEKEEYIKEVYPGLSFKSWKSHATFPAVFQ